MPVYVCITLVGISCGLQLVRVTRLILAGPCENGLILPSVVVVVESALLWQRYRPTLLAMFRGLSTVDT
jgi:hypothetical protein